MHTRSWPQSFKASIGLHIQHKIQLKGFLIIYKASSYLTDLLFWHTVTCNFTLPSFTQGFKLYWGEPSCVPFLHPSSILFFHLSVLIPFLHPTMFWFPIWTPGSALCCHMTQIQRSRVVKYKACTLYRQKHHKATVALDMWTEQPLAYFPLHSCDLSTEQTLCFHSHKQVGGILSNLER